MLKTRWYLLLLPLLAGLVFVGCSDDDNGNGTEPVPLTPAEQFEAMATAGAAYINSAAPAIITAATLNDNLEDYTVIDCRSETDYNAGHIEGAIHTSLGDLLDDLDDGTITTDLPIVSVCYTGQSAGHAAVALRMLGHDAYVMGWGMASWNTTLAFKWTDSVGDGLPVEYIETTANDLTTTYDWPEWDVGAFSAEEVVYARVDAMLDGGFKKKTVQNILDDGPDTYFILNYFGEADYLGTGTSGVPGHIEGAYQFTPKASLAMDQQLEHLPTDMPIVVYCWSGQHASQVIAYLNMLGYEAYDLVFSSNALWYSSLTAHNWDETTLSNDFPLVTD